MPRHNGMTKATPSSPVKRPGKRWGDAGVSERFVVQDTQLAVTPQQQQVILADAGILSEIQHHFYATNLTVTHGTGTNAKDVFGPYDAVNWYQFTAGANTPLVSASGARLGIFQTMEYPLHDWEANVVPAGAQNPLTNASDIFNFPSATGIFRFWMRVPLAIKWVGMPGGQVGYIVLQNKRIPNVIKPTFNVSGAAAPYNMASNTFGNAAYLISGNDTVTGTPQFETWKTLHTVPNSREQMPIFGFTRYIQEVQLPYSGTSFTYNYEPGGVLLRAMFQLVDATAQGGVATNNINTITYQYGTNKQLDIFTPQRNLQEQLELYGRVLPQGCYVLDYYTRKRNLVDAKSTENTANVQTVIQFAAGYAVPANSQAYILLDKVYVVQNYLGN